MKDLTVGKPIKIILRFALPILIGNIFNLAYNLADTRIIGSFLGNDALAAVGGVTTLNDLIVGFIVGLANGFAVLTARFFGMGDRDKVRRSFALSLEFGVLIAGIIMLLTLLGMDGILRILNVEEQYHAASSTYMTIILYGLLFSIFYNVMASSLRAIGDAYTPLLFLVVSVLLNIGLDLLFVGTWNAGVGGAALATILSQLISAVSCFIYTWLRYPFLHFSGEDLKPDKEYNRPLLAGGLSMGIMMCFVHLGSLSLQTAINTFGRNTIVAHTAARKITSFFMLPFSVLGTAMATFCGQNFGAGRPDRIKEGLKSSLFVSYLWVCVVILMAYTICPSLIRAVTATSEPEIIETACLYLRVDTLLYVLVPTISILRNSLQGMGDHKTPVISSFMEFVVKLVMALTFAKLLGYWGIIVAEPTAWVIMVIPLIVSMVHRLKPVKGADS